MTDTIKISDSVTEIDLYYDSAPGFQMVASGISLGLPEHRHLFHQSEWIDGDLLVRENVGNRRWPMKLKLSSGASDDEIANKLVALNKLAKQARKYQAYRQGNEVYLHIKLDGATNWTRYTVVDIDYQNTDIFNYFNRKTQNVEFGDAVSIEVVTNPYGYGDWEYLRNELVNPHMEEGTSSLAYGWNALGTSSTSRETANATKLIGSYSQKFISHADGDGISSDNIDAPSNNRDVVASANVYLSDAGTVTTELYNVTDGTAIDSATTTTTSEYIKLSVAGVLPSSKSGSLRVSSDSGMSVYVDKCYFQFSDTEPNAWCSSTIISNYLEGSGVVPYIDVDDVPGDVDAETAWIIEGDNTYYYIGRYTKGDIDDIKYWEELDTDQADAARTNNGYDTASASTSTWTVAESISITPNTNEGMVPGTYLAFVALNVSTGSETGKARAVVSGWDSVYDIQSEETEISLSTTFQLVPLGPFSLGEHPHDGYWPSDGTATDYTYVPDSTFYIEAQVNMDSAKTVGIDFICLMPVDEYYAIFELGDRYIVLFNDEHGSPLNRTYDPTTEVYSSNFPFLGSVPLLRPGKENRFIIMYDDDHDHVLDSDTRCYIKYRPRTELLLGTE